jgi:hypothetical protein
VLDAIAQTVGVVVPLNVLSGCAPLVGSYTPSVKATRLYIITETT